MYGHTNDVGPSSIEIRSGVVVPLGGWNLAIPIILGIGF